MSDKKTMAGSSLTWRSGYGRLLLRAGVQVRIPRVYIFANLFVNSISLSFFLGF
jgi:hypothetical protein